MVDSELDSPGKATFASDMSTVVQFPTFRPRDLEEFVDMSEYTAASGYVRERLTGWQAPSTGPMEVLADHDRKPKRQTGRRPSGVEFSFSKAPIDHLRLEFAHCAGLTDRSLHRAVPALSGAILDAHTSANFGRHAEAHCWVRLQALGCLAALASNVLGVE